MTILDSGNVGIGTTNPANYKLVVSGIGAGSGLEAGLHLTGGQSGGDYDGIGYNFINTGTTGVYDYTSADTASRLEFTSGGFNFMTAPGGTAGNPITFTKAMTILQGGAVGIGTTGPSTKLDVLAAANKEIQVYTPSAASGISDFSIGGIGWLLSEPGAGIMNSGIYTYNTSGGAKDNLAISARSDLVFQTGADAPSGNGEVMRIASTGEVGIGTTNPAERLDLGGGNIVMGYEQVTNSCTGPGAGGSASCAVSCSSGKQVLGGGCAGGGGFGSVQNTFPSSTSQWTCYMDGIGASGFTTMTVYAICANIK